MYFAYRLEEGCTHEGLWNKLNENSVLENNDTASMTSGA